MMVKELEQITRKEFEAYEQVRASGVINMFAVSAVMELADLDKETCFGIMKHYRELVRRYPGVRDGTD